MTARTDPTRPRVRTSEAFTRNGSPFSGLQQPREAAEAIFKLDKPGQVPGDIFKLYDGYAVAQLKEKKAVSEEDWKKERRLYLFDLRQAKQRDALIDYVARLREKYAKEVKYNRSIIEPKKEEDKEAPEAPAPEGPEEEE